MSNKSVSTSFSGSTSYDDTIFVYLEQLETDETASIAEVAELVDEIYGITSCVEEEEVTETETGAETEEVAEEAEVAEEEEVTEEDLYDAVSSTMELPSCDAFDDGSWSAQLAIWKSHVDEDHVLRLVGGVEVAVSTVATTVIDSEDVSSATYTILKKPITGSYNFVWVGLAIDVNGNSVNPEIKVTGNTLWWEGATTGKINCTYESQYTLTEILVDATGETDEDGEIVQGECTAWVFHKGASDNLDLSEPTDSDLDNSLYCDYTSKVVIPKEDIPLWESTTTEYYCECSNTVSHRVYSPDPTPAQLLEYIYPGTTKTVHGGFVDCNETDPNISDPEFYEQKCCYPPTISLPSCKTIYSKNEGGKTLGEVDTAAYIVRFAPKPVSFISRSAKDGDCGNIITTFRMPDRDCCEFVEELAWDSDNSATVIADNSRGSVFVIGGQLPVTVSVVGSGFYLNQARTAKSARSYGNTIPIYTGEACGSCTITVTDGCSSTGGIVMSPSGQWSPIPLSEAPGFIQSEDEIPDLYGQSKLTVTGYSGKYKVVQTYSGVAGGTTSDIVCLYDHPFYPTGPVYVRPALTNGWVACGQYLDHFAKCFTQCSAFYPQLRNVPLAYEWVC